MEKKSKGKVVVITIVILALLGAVGYLIYDKNNTEKKITDYETQLKDLKKEIKEYKDDTKDLEITEQPTKIAGYYKWGQTLETETNICDAVKNPLNGQTTEILFKEDGTYQLHFAGDCIGGYGGNGIYTINGDKLTLQITDKNGQCVDNEICEGEYKIDKNNTIIDLNNEKIIYLKTEKDRLQTEWDN